jgi:methionyl-tRNA formyltransferase
VASLAQTLGLPVLEVATLKTPEVVAELRERQTPFAVLAAFGKIIPPTVLDLYPKGIVNVHPSLLPLYRGSAPIQYALRDGVPETGVSLIVLDSEVDHGPVLAQQVVPISQADDAVTLGSKLATQAVELLMQTLPRYVANELAPVPQDHSQASFTAMVEREHGQADFSKPALDLDRMRRAFTPWPGLWTIWQGKRLKLISTGVSEQRSSKPGTVEQRGGEIEIVCGSGSLIVTELQLEGGKAQSAADFIRGHQKFVGSVLPS